MKRLLCFAVLLVLPLSGQNLFKQFQYVTVEGNVVEQSGAPVADCFVEIRVLSNQKAREEGTAVVGTSPTAGSGEGDVYTLGTDSWNVNDLDKAGWAETDENGHYRIQGIPTPGSYVLVVKGMAGYKKTQMPLRIDSNSGEVITVKDLVLDKQVEIDSKTRKLLKQADKALKANQLDEAESVLLEVDSYRQDLASVYVSLGNIYVIQKKMEQAYNNYAKAFELGERNETLCFAAAELAFSASRFDEAASYLEAVLDRDPESPKALYMAGLCRYNLQHFPEASKLFDRYMAVQGGKSSEPTFLYVYGMTELALKDQKKATKLLYAAYVNGYHGDPIFMKTLAGALLADQQDDKAKAVLEKLLTTYDDFDGREEAQKLLESL